MGYLLPGSRFVRYGDSLLDESSARQAIVEVPKLFAARSQGVNVDKVMQSKLAAASISRTAPTFNDPRYTFTTLSIPTDQRTLNGLYRFFDDMDPIVGNAIRLHVEFPLSRISLSDCGDPTIQRHFEDMCDRINLNKFLFDIGVEYWRIGNVFPFLSWNVDDYMWEQGVILNPDYVTVEGTYLNKTPYIRLQPDEHLRRIVTTGQPRELYDQLPEQIIKYVRLGQEIPLSPNNVFHLAQNKAPYETLGRSIIKRILKTLIYEDRMLMANFAIATRQVIPITVVKLGDPQSGFVPTQDEIDDFKEMLGAREVDPNFCYDEKTECLTDKGWVTYDQLTYNHKIASFNKETNTLKYYKPSYINIQDYDGDMIHFKTRNIDIKVTPNHRMLVQRDDEWQIVRADEVTVRDRFRASIDHWEGEKPPKTLDIAGKKVDSKDFFDFVGWWLAEGSLGKKGSDKFYSVHVTQSKPKGVEQLKQLFAKLPWKFRHDCLGFEINNAKLARWLEANCGCGALNKYVPDWMKFADKEHLTILLNSWLSGDGTGWDQKLGTRLRQGFSVSKQLIDDMYEIALKIGYGVSVRTRENNYLWKNGERHYTRSDGTKYHDLHILTLSETEKMKFPFLPIKSAKVKIDDIDFPRKTKQVDWDKVDLPVELVKVNGNVSTLATLTKTNPVCIWEQIENQKVEVKVDPGRRVQQGYEFGYKAIKRVPYKGKIWCPSVPETGIIVTRRGGKTAVQGQSIVYHWGIDIQFYGAAGKIMNLANEFTRTLKWKLIGLGISEAILTGGANFATAYAQLEVLRQRYLHFQLLLETFVHKGLFEPVARLCGFYKTSTLHAGYGGIFRKYGDPDYEALEKIANPYALSNEEYAEFRAKKLADVNTNLGGPVKHVYPHLDWDLMSLNNDMQFKNFLMNFDRLFPQERKISEDTYYKAANLNKDAEQTKLKKEHKERLENALDDAKINKEYLEKFQKEGLTPPPEIAPPVPGMPGEGGAPGVFPPGPGAPTLPGAPTPGGGVGPGGTVTAPSAPVGQTASPEGPGGTPRTPGTPAQARDESINIQHSLTRSSIEGAIEKEGVDVQKGLDREAITLKKTNELMLKKRNQERDDSNVDA